MLLVECNSHDSLLEKGLPPPQGVQQNFYFLQPGFHFVGNQVFWLTVFLLVASICFGILKASEW